MKRALLTILALLPTIALATINTIVVNKTGVTVSPGHTGNIATSQSTVVTATVNVPGPQGVQGVPGEGVPAGGTDGQVLTKKGVSNYSTHWQDVSGGASSWNDLTDKPDVVVVENGAVFVPDLSVTGTLYPSGRITGGIDNFNSILTMFELNGQYGNFGTVTAEGLAVPFTGDVRTMANIFSALDSIPPAQVSSDWNSVVSPTQILNKPTIPAAQVPADWNSIINPTQILNKPVIPVVCGTDPETAVFDGGKGDKGPNGSSVTCHVNGPVQAFAYDTGGLNPFPALEAFTVQLWEGITDITGTITAYVWTTGGAGNTVSGSGSASSFTPAVAPIFNNRSTNNYVSAQVNYSTASGKGTCSDVASIAVTKPGAKGDKGDTGEATITKAGVVGQFTAGTAGGNAMLFFPSVAQGDSQLQIGVGDTLANLRLKILPSGMIMIIRPDGKYDFMYDTTTRQLRMGNYSTTSSRSNVVIDHTGEITGYKRNGTVLAFRLHSSLTIY